MELVRSHAIRLVNRVLQMDGGCDEEDTVGGPILEVDDSTKDLNADQPEDHCTDESLISLILV